MLRIVLPAGIPAPVSVSNVVPVAAVNIRIPDEIIIVVDVDVVVASPPATPAPTATPCRSHRESNPK
jgi:hypothetical protein